MPTSNLTVWPAILHLVWEVQPNRVLDVGPGWGKAGILLREYVNPMMRVDAVEAWPGYVGDRLLAIYDRVTVGDVRSLADGELASYDLVLMVDVIEHLDKDEGAQLLDRIPGRVVVCTPETFFSNGPGLPATEEHRSLWRVEDFGERVEVDRSQHGAVLVRLAPA